MLLTMFKQHINQEAHLFLEQAPTGMYSVYIQAQEETCNLIFDRLFSQTNSSHTSSNKPLQRAGEQTLICKYVVPRDQRQHLQMDRVAFEKGLLSFMSQDTHS